MFFLLQGLPWILKPSFYVVAPQECQSDWVPWDDTFCSWSSLHVCSSEKLSVLFITLFRHRTFSPVPSFLTSGPEFWEHLNVFCHSIWKCSKKGSSNHFWEHLKMFCYPIWNVPKKIQELPLRTFENFLSLHLKCFKKKV